MVIWVAVVGRSSLAGAIAGTLLVNFAKDKISTVLPAFWLYALGALFIIVVTVAPRGLAGVVESIRFGPRPPRAKPEPAPAAEAPAAAEHVGSSAP
jgi:urea transport system permease protein